MKLNGVERVSARLDAHVLEHLVVAQLLNSHAVGERLGNRLDSKQLVAIADFEHSSIGSGDADSEMSGIGFPQFGDIGRDVSVVIGLILAVQFFDQDLYLVSFHSRPRLYVSIQ